MSGNPTFAYLNQPIRNPLSLQSADPLTRAQEIGRLRELERIKNQPRGLSNVAPIVERQKRNERYRLENEEKFLLEQERKLRLQSVYGESLAARRANLGISSGGGFKSGLANIDSRLNSSNTASTAATTKGFDQDAFNKFTAKSFIAIATLEGFTSAVRGTNQGLDTLLGVVNKLTFAFTGIAALQQFGGINVTNFSDKILGLFGKGGGIFSKIGGFLAPLVRFTPVIGQLGIGLTLVNSIVEDLTGKSGLQRLREALGFASEEAENAAKSFRENLGTMFSETGVFTSERTNKDVRQRIEDIRQQAITKRRAESKGIATSGKSAKETAQEEAVALIEDALASVGTGIIRTESSYSRTGQVSIKRIEQSLLDFDADASLYLQDALENVINQSRAELESLAASKGVKSIEGKSLIEAETPKIQAEIIRLYLEGVKKQFSTLQNAASTGRSQEFFADFSDFFIGQPKTTKIKKGIDPTTSKPIPTTPLKVSQERVENLLEVKSLEQEILTLEELSIKTQLRTGELTDLEAAKREAMLRVLESERTERQKVIDLVGDSVRAYGKADLAENVPTSALTEIEKKIQSFNGDAEQARALVQEIAASFAPDKAKELVDIFESGNRKLEAQKKTQLGTMHPGYIAHLPKSTSKIPA